MYVVRFRNADVSYLAVDNVNLILSLALIEKDQPPHVAKDLKADAYIDGDWLHDLNIVDRRSGEIIKPMVDSDSVNNESLDNEDKYGAVVLIAVESNQNYLGVQKNPPALALCPATDKCISTSKNISDIVHYAPPWNYNPSEGRGSKQPVTKEVAMEELLEVVK
ncbi:hypothetical protein Tco_0873265 [Tanacetum coccineum]